MSAAAARRGGRRGGRGRRPRHGGRRRDRRRRERSRPGGELALGAERYRLREATVVLSFEPGGARLDVFADAGGEAPAGLALDSLVLEGVRSLSELEGRVVIDPPPGLVVPVSAAAARAGGRAEPDASTQGSPSAGERAPDEEEDAQDNGEEDEVEQASGREALERYRAERAREGAATPEAALPELDPDELEAIDAEFERAVVTPTATYWAETVRVAFGRVSERRIEVEIHARARAIGPEGEVEQAVQPVHARLLAELEMA